MTQLTEAIEIVNPLEKLVAQSGLEPTKAQFILAQFQGYFDLAAEWERRAQSIVVTAPNQTEEMAIAREGRLFLKGKRIEVENARKNLKEQSLREGKAIDGIANVLKGLITPIEEYLDAQEHFVQIKEQKRVEYMINERRVNLIHEGLNPDLFNLALMTDLDIVLVIKTERRRKVEEAEATRRNEEDRIAREAESKRVREENEKLRAEQELARKRIEEEQMERRRLEAELRAKETEAKREQSRLAADIKAKEEAEAAERRRQEQVAKKAARAPDKVKLLAWADYIDRSVPLDVVSEEASEIVRKAKMDLGSIAIGIRTSAGAL